MNSNLGGFIRAHDSLHSAEEPRAACDQTGKNKLEARLLKFSHDFERLGVHGRVGAAALDAKKNVSVHVRMLVVCKRYPCVSTQL